MRYARHVFPRATVREKEVKVALIGSFEGASIFEKKLRSNQVPENLKKEAKF